MVTILDEFLKLSDLSLDDIHNLEIELQKRFLELFRRNFISREVYELNYPIGKQRSRMYGLPKFMSLVSLCDLFCLCVISHNMHW